MTTHNSMAQSRVSRCAAVVVIMVVIFVAVCAGSSVHALTITRVFVNSTAPPTITGGGSLDDVFNQAADMWEAAITDPHALMLNFKWQDLTNPNIAEHTLGFQIGGRETLGTISFDNNGTNWFLDPTPGLHQEWSSYQESADDFGGGELITGRNHLGYTGPKIAGQTPHDLLTVALHEIGHALGMSSANASYQSETWDDNEANIESPLPFAGSAIPTNNTAVPTVGFSTSNAHLDGSTLPDSLLGPTIQFGRRSLIDDASILANAQISSFSQVSVVPEPSSAALALMSTVGWLLIGRRRRRRG